MVSALAQKSKPHISGFFRRIIAQFPLTPSPFLPSPGEFHRPRHLSAGAREVLDGLICVDPARRFTMEQLLSHPWLVEDAPSAMLSPEKDRVIFEARLPTDIDPELISIVALHYDQPEAVVLEALKADSYDHVAADYALLTMAKRSRRPLRLGVASGTWLPRIPAQLPVEAPEQAEPEPAPEPQPEPEPEPEISAAGGGQAALPAITVRDAAAAAGRPAPDSGVTWPLPTVRSAMVSDGLSSGDSSRLPSPGASPLLRRPTAAAAQEAAPRPTAIHLHVGRSRRGISLGTHQETSAHAPPDMGLAGASANPSDPLSARTSVSSMAASDDVSIIHSGNLSVAYRSRLSPADLRGLVRLLLANLGVGTRVSERDGAFDVVLRPPPSAVKHPHGDAATQLLAAVEQAAAKLEAAAAEGRTPPQPVAALDHSRRGSVEQGVVRLELRLARVVSPEELSCVRLKRIGGDATLYADTAHWLLGRLRVLDGEALSAAQSRNPSRAASPVTTPF